MFELRKIGFVKRMFAWLLDAILLAVLTTGLMWIISLICGFSEAQAIASEYNQKWDDFRQEELPAVAEAYGYVYQEAENGYTVTKDGAEATLDDVMGDLVKDVAEFYGFTYTKTESGHAISKGGAFATLGDVKEVLLAQEGERPAFADVFLRYTELPSANLKNHQNRYVYTMLFMMLSVGLLLAYLILDFILPIIFKNGQTVGKKIFGIGLVRPNCVKITNLALFARTVLGKFAIETMFPVLLIFLFFFGGLGWLALVLLAALFLLNAIVFFATKNKTPIHDVVAGTVAVDLKIQIVFESEEELAEKKALAEKERLESEKEQQ